MTATKLTYFLTTGNFYDVEAPDPAGSTNQSLFQVITGIVTFWPRVPPGFVAMVANLDLSSAEPGIADPLPGVALSTAVAIAPVQARILSGQLQTINVPDTPGVKLLSNTTDISGEIRQIDPVWLHDHKLDKLSAGSLVYDVQFSHVVYSEAAQQIAGFAFIAPTDNTPVVLTDPGLPTIPYGGP